MPPAEAALVLGLIVLGALAGLAVWLSRYELGTAGGLPARLDRFTGQVIGCVPGQGCVELIPAGEPSLRRPVLKPLPAPAAASAGNAAAAPPASP